MTRWKPPRTERNPFRGSYRPTPVSRSKKSSRYEPEGFVKGDAVRPRVDLRATPEQADRIRPRIFRTPEQIQRRQRLAEAAAKSTYAQWKRAEDRRRFHPAGENAQPSNIFGASALFKKSARQFLETALPCVDRVVRRQVLFAIGKGGRGYRKKKHRNWRSLIPC